MEGIAEREGKGAGRGVWPLPAEGGRLGGAEVRKAPRCVAEGFASAALDARWPEIVEVLSSEYYALYLVNLKGDRIQPFLMRNEVAEHHARRIEDRPCYSAWLSDYCSRYVVGEDSDDVCNLLSRENLLANMPESGGDFSVVCKRLFGDEEQYIELRLLQVSGEDDEFVLAARNVNDEMMNQMEQKEALRSALALARHANDAKTTFLTNVSHDFRTPLNSIMGFSNLALAHLDDAGRVRDCLERILSSSDHLLDLINDVLDVSRIESGRIDLAQQPIDLAQLMGELHDAFSVQAAQAGIDLSVDVSGVAHPKVVADQLRLSQVLVNTIGNALKYTDRGGKVDVAVRERAQGPSGAALYEFVVADTGCGMSQGFVDRIFMPFERDSSGGAHDAEGTGLGMTIAKNLVDLLGGSIEVQSALGQGSTFTITLPLKVERGPRAEAAGGKAPVAAGEGEPAAVPAEGKASAPVEGKVSASARAEVASFEGFRVLVVDDDELSREMMLGILQDRGFDVEQATDGDEAVAMVDASAEGHFDAVIMDMRMPRMSGDDATRAIRALARADVSSMPIIAATADAFEEGHRRARDAGMTAHITKPLDIGNLMAILDRCLRQGELRREDAR